ncbi:U3 snoRNP protein, partial [Dispira simplex]
MSDIIETPLTEAFLDQVVARPERFLLEDAQLPTELLHNTRDCFASGKSLEFYELGVLEGLHVKDFPDEQIWEQLQLRNQPVLRTFSRKLGRLMNWVEELADEAEKEDDDGESIISQGSIAEEVTSEVGSTTSDEIGHDGVSDSDQAEWAGLEDGESSVSDVEALDSDSDQEESEGLDDESVDDQEDDESDAAEGSVDEPVVKKYEVDDDFFQLDAMEKYVNAAEKEEEKDHELRRALQRGKITADLNEGEDGDDDDSDEEIDYFQDLNGPMRFGLGNEGDDDQGDPNVMYDEFFGSQKFQRQDRPRQEPLSVSFENDHTGDESEPDYSDADTLRASKPRSLFGEDDGSAGEKGRQEELSRFEQQQQRLQKRIEQLEAENVGLRDWCMVGEVSARDRPENSLLEQDLEFDH